MLQRPKTQAFAAHQAVGGFVKGLAAARKELEAPRPPTAGARKLTHGLANAPKKLYKRIEQHRKELPAQQRTNDTGCRTSSSSHLSLRMPRQVCATDHRLLAAVLIHFEL